MKEALKGIEADLAKLSEQRVEQSREHERRAVALEAEFERHYEAIDAQVEALTEARSTLLAVNDTEPVAEEPAPEVAEEAPKVDLRAGKSKATVAAADRMTKRLRTEPKPMTARELGEVAGLEGRGAHSVRTAAVRLLVQEGALVVANGSGQNGSTLYAPGARVV